MFRLLAIQSWTPSKKVLRIFVMAPPRAIANFVRPHRSVTAVMLRSMDQQRENAMERYLVSRLLTIRVGQLRRKLFNSSPMALPKAKPSSIHLLVPTMTAILLLMIQWRVNASETANFSSADYLNSKSPLNLFEPSSRIYLQQKRVRFVSLR